MRVAWGNVGVLREVRVQFGVLVMSEELVMIDVCNWCLWRCDISLGEETGLCVCFNPRRLLLRSGRPCTRAVLGRGRKIEIDSMGEKTVLSVSVFSSWEPFNKRTLGQTLETTYSETTKTVIVAVYQVFGGQVVEEGNSKGDRNGRPKIAQS
jgi:hypothetical protein